MKDLSCLPTYEFREFKKKIIWNVLTSFGTNPDAFHIIYVTDNGSNLISALAGEAHIRCVCHCINLIIISITIIYRMKEL
jgi:hypothetical protein